jgi:hypothetical protein
MKKQFYFVIYLLLAFSATYANSGINIAEKQDTLKHGGKLTGGRSRKAIMFVVMNNIAELKRIYNERLILKPGLRGKIWVKYAIDEFGNVIYCEAIQDSVGDELLRNQIIQNIKTWKFENIYKPGDVTTVVYPFVFSQSGYINNSSKGKNILIGVLITLGIFTIATIAIIIQSQ